MNLDFSQDDINFRNEVKDFINISYTQEMKDELSRSKNGSASKELHVKWQKSLYEKGWIAPNWPEEHGGAGFTTTQKYIFETEMALAGAPRTVPFGLSMVAPVLMEFGTEEQKKKYLPDILSTKVWWCQGYSEPGSGSDLASLQCKAEDKGDHYLVNGTKIWTTLAQHADMIFCLVRTSKTQKPQEGISFLLIDMKSSGIDIRPLITLDQSPAPYQEVNQVFFEDVKVPKENLVGEENKGWTYAKYLLEFERGNSYSPSLYRGIQKLKDIAKDTLVGADKYLINDMSFINKLNQCEIEVQALEFVELRIFSALSAGQRVGAESSILKCRGTELQQKIQELSVEAIGYWSTPFIYDTFANINEPSIGPDYAATITPSYLNGRKTTIYAGSNEIQRNIISKAVLGL
ncbi:MAG: pimeloyl-CoA dehydrogenase large subunit [Rhizobiales bacterium TMED168]|nr:MAG: pimeloyl-CoA dehydrogenase large subunit [Rhizobiales bacterium TMED168]